MTEAEEYVKEKLSNMTFACGHCHKCKNFFKKGFLYCPECWIENDEVSIQYVSNSRSKQ